VGWDDEKVDAVVAADRGQQADGLAGEVAQSQDPAVDAEAAGMGVPAGGGQYQSGDWPADLVEGQHEAGQFGDGVGGAGPPGAVQQGAA
jgi:hypothetical protein